MEIFIKRGMYFFCSVRRAAMYIKTETAARGKMTGKKVMKMPANIEKKPPNEKNQSEKLVFIYAIPE